MSLNKIKSLLNENNFDFHYLSEVESTMSKIKHYSSERNICLMANKQKNGFGRRGSKWVSPEGNVYISILLKNVLNISNHFLNTAYTSNIVCDVIEKVCKNKTMIKWPNDILIDDKKICGIISEIYNKDNNIFINTGVGINIISSPNVKEYITSNVNEYNKDINSFNFVYKLLERYLKNFHILENRSNIIIEKYKSRLRFLRKKIILKLDSNKIKEGIFYGLNEDGSIILKKNSFYENIYNARILI